MTSDLDLLEAIAGHIEKLAMSARAPNPLTPELMMLCAGLREECAKRRVPSSHQPAPGDTQAAPAPDGLEVAAARFEHEVTQQTQECQFQRAPHGWLFRCSEWLDLTPILRAVLSQAQSAADARIAAQQAEIEGLRKRVENLEDLIARNDAVLERAVTRAEAAEASHAAARDNFHTMQQAANTLRIRAEAAEARIRELEAEQELGADAIEAAADLIEAYQLDDVEAVKDAAARLLRARTALQEASR